MSDSDSYQPPPSDDGFYSESEDENPPPAQPSQGTKVPAAAAVSQPAPAAASSAQPVPATFQQQAQQQTKQQKTPTKTKPTQQPPQAVPQTSQPQPQYDEQSQSTNTTTTAAAGGVGGGGGNDYYYPPPPVAYDPGPNGHQTMRDTTQDGQQKQTTRVLSPGEFTMLFRDSIAKGIHIPPEGHHQQQNQQDNNVGGLMQGLEPRRPATAGSAHRAVASSRGQAGSGFIDPYNRTKWKNRISAPSTRSSSQQRLGSGYGQPQRQSVGGGNSRLSTKLKKEVHEGSGAAGRGGTAGSANQQAAHDTIHRLMEEINHLKYESKTREEEYNRQRTELSRMQRKMNSQQQEILHNRPEREAQTVESLINALQGKVHHLEASLQKSEDQCHSLRTNAKSQKLAEMSTQNAVYLAESRRLQRQLNEYRTSSNEAERGGALQEAQLTVRHKDSQIAELHERLRAMQDELKTNRANATAWKKAYEEGNHVVDEHRQKLDDLKQAPLEINRLRVELDQSRKAETEAKEEVARIEQIHQKKLEIALQSAKSEKHADYDVILSERDAFKSQTEVLQREVETLQRDQHSRAVVDEQAVEARISAKVHEVELMSQDRERALRQEIAELQQSNETKAKQNRDLQEKHREEMETFKEKEKARQENLIMTMGTYEKNRQVEQLRQTQERERQLAEQQDALEEEKAKWKAEYQQRQDQLSHVENALKRTEAKAAETQRQNEIKQQQMQYQQQNTAVRGGYGADTVSTTSSTGPAAQVTNPQAYGVSSIQQPAPPTPSASGPTGGTASIPTPQQQSTDGNRRTDSPVNIPQRKAAPQPAVPSRYHVGAVDDTVSDVTIRNNKVGAVAGSGGAGGSAGVRGDTTHDDASQGSLMMEEVINQSNDITEDPSSERTAAPAQSSPTVAQRVEEQQQQKKEEATPPQETAVIPTPATDRQKTPETPVDVTKQESSAVQVATPPPAELESSPPTAAPTGNASDIRDSQTSDGRIVTGDGPATPTAVTEPPSPPAHKNNAPVLPPQQQMEDASTAGTSSVSEKNQEAPEPAQPQPVQKEMSSSGNRLAGAVLGNRTFSAPTTVAAEPSAPVEEQKPSTPPQNSAAETSAELNFSGASGSQTPSQTPVGKAANNTSSANQESAASGAKSETADDDDFEVADESISSKQPPSQAPKTDGDKTEEVEFPSDDDDDDESFQVNEGSNKPATPAGAKPRVDEAVRSKSGNDKTEDDDGFDVEDDMEDDDDDTSSGSSTVSDDDTVEEDKPAPRPTAGGGHDDDVVEDDIPSSDGSSDEH